MLAMIAGHFGLIVAGYCNRVWLAIMRIVSVFAFKFDHHAGASWYFHNLFPPSYPVKKLDNANTNRNNGQNNQKNNQDRNNIAGHFVSSFHCCLAALIDGILLDWYPHLLHS